MTQPFLSIVTRHLECRKKYFLRCALSIARQTCQDFEHIVIDCQPDGYIKAQQALFDNRMRCTGEYVFMLDDDDYLCNTDFISGLRQFVTEHGNLDLIWVKWKTIGTFDNIPMPFPDEWERLSQGEHPTMGRMGTSCYVVKRKLYQKYVIHAQEDWMCGDYTFIKAIYINEPNLSIAMMNEFGAAYDHVGHDHNLGEDLCTNQSLTS